jgi:hypothetical protein
MFFIKRLATLVFHLLSISIAVYTRPEVGISLLTGIKEDTDDIDSVEITRFVFFQGSQSYNKKVSLTWLSLAPK